jgi:hypothetical protein
METRHDLRRQNRRACDHNITVLWRDTGGYEKYVQARVLDICELGLRFESPEAPPPQAYLTLGAAKLGLVGHASVRHSMRVRSSKYAVGVEFTAGLRWTPKD